MTSFAPMETNDLNPVEEVQRLFIQNAEPIRGFILGLLPDIHQADDVFQEVFLIVTRKASDFQIGTNFLAWARGIARYKVLQHFDQKRKSPLPLDPEVMEAICEAAPTADDLWASHEAALAQCLQKLAPKTREILDLRYLQGLLPPEISQRLSREVSAIYVALGRARKLLRECARQVLAIGNV